MIGSNHCLYSMCCTHQLLNSIRLILFQNGGRIVEHFLNQFLVQLHTCLCLDGVKVDLHSFLHLTRPKRLEEN